MAAQAGCGISVLPVEVLSKVLQHVDLRDRLLSCSLVCSLWREAAAMSITAINLPRCNDTKATSLSVWLRAHAAKAKLDSISVLIKYGSDIQNNSLLLPVQHLTSLRTMRLKNVWVTPADTAEAGAEAETGAQAEAEAEEDCDWDVAAPKVLLTPELSGLTRLDLLDCQVWLKGVHLLTGLQHLAVQLLLPRPGQGDVGKMLHRNRALLHRAIPNLTHLTALHLCGSAAQDSALVHLSKLTCLQELQLTQTSSHGISEASFKELPCSLTRLEFDVEGIPFAGGPDFYFSPSSTPGMCKLTALRELELCGSLERRYLVHVDVFTALGALHKLELSACTLTAAVGGCTLSVLTALTQLQHLQLPECDDGVLVSPADYAAATASQQLTCLKMRGFAGPERAFDIFPADRRLPSLQSLEVDIFWMEETEAMERVISCCPGLQELDTLACGGDDVAAVESESWAASLESLTGLSALTSLSMLTVDVSMSKAVYKAIAALTGLQALSLEALVAEELWPAVELTACRQLTCLQLDVSASGIQGDLSVNATNKAPAGSPPDVWRQIPALVLQSAADNFESVNSATGGTQTSLHNLLSATAQASSHALQRESQLEQKVEGLEQQLASSMQQVAHLQACMEAVLLHLQLAGPTSGGVV